MSSVFISGSISIKNIPSDVEESLSKIIEQNMQVLVGDAKGIDSMIQKYLKRNNYINVTVYSIYTTPRYLESMFNKKYIAVSGDLKKERERQTEKDAAMTMQSDYSLVIWDGKSKGSYQNILRAIKYEKKLKVYLYPENRFMNQEAITKEKVEFIYRENNGYTAKEVVEYLTRQGKNYFKQTRALNTYLVDNNIITKIEGIYTAVPKYQKLFIVDSYNGRVKGIKFNNNFLDFIEKHIAEANLKKDSSLF